MSQLQLQDIQEMTVILSKYKDLFLETPTQAQISEILRKRKAIRAIRESAPETKLPQLI